MDLAIDVTLTALATIGSIVAISGKTWDDTKPRVRDKLTRAGIFALSCLALSFALGVLKEIRTHAGNRQFSQKIDNLARENAFLLSDNTLLRENLSTVQSILVQQERVQRIYFHVDAFDGEERRGFNTLDRLLQRTHPGRDRGDRAVGIYFVIDYGELELYVAGLGGASGEEWYYKLFFDSEDRAGYNETMPVRLEKDGPFLIRGTLGDGDLEKFWRSRPQIIRVLSRPQYPEELFDPGFELGQIKIIGYGYLRRNTDAFKFAQQKADSWFIEEVSIPREFLMQWHVVMDLNNRQIREVEQVLDGQPSRIETERLLRWEIDPKYQANSNEAWIAPVGSQWTDFFSAMNGNVRQLLYGKRDGQIKIEPRTVPPVR